MGLGAEGKGEIIASRAERQVANSVVRLSLLIRGGVFGQGTRLHIEEPQADFGTRQRARIVAAKETVAVAGEATVKHVADRAWDKRTEASQGRPGCHASSEYEQGSVGAEQESFGWCVAVEDEDHSVILNAVNLMATQDLNCWQTL